VAPCRRRQCSRIAQHTLGQIVCVIPRTFCRLCAPRNMVFPHALTSPLNKASWQTRLAAASASIGRVVHKPYSQVLTWNFAGAIPGQASPASSSTTALSDERTSNELVRRSSAEVGCNCRGGKCKRWASVRKHKHSLPAGRIVAKAWPKQVPGLRGFKAYGQQVRLIRCPRPLRRRLLHGPHAHITSHPVMRPGPLPRMVLQRVENCTRHVLGGYLSRDGSGR